MTGYGLMLATLGSIDSLLTSLVADNITRTQHACFLRARLRCNGRSP